MGYLFYKGLRGLEDKNCKDCLHIKNLEKNLEKLNDDVESSTEKTYDMFLKLQDRVVILERRSDKNEERVAMIFNILNEIKDSVKIIADKIDNYERTSPGISTTDNLRSDLKELATRVKERVKYPFTGKIVCGICGKKYRHKDRQGRVSWSCSTYLKYGKESCPSKQIPEDILISLTTKVLELKEFDEAIFEKKIKKIQVQEPNTLMFVFQDGKTVKEEWSYKPRSQSWSEETRQRVRKS